MLFSSFREGREWYIFIELASTMILSTFLGIVTLPCRVLNGINVTAQAVDLLLIVTLRPHHTFRDYVMDIIVYVAKLLMAILSVLPPRHPFRYVCEVAGYVVLVSGVKDVVFFFLGLYVKKQDKDEARRAQEAAPLQGVYVPPDVPIAVPPEEGIEMTVATNWPPTVLAPSAAVRPMPRVNVPPLPRNATTTRRPLWGDL